MTPAPDNGTVPLFSSRSVSEVLEHLLSLLQAKGVTIFAVIDHSGEAAAAGFQMPATKVVIFGNPKAGTPVMLAAPDSALDLPLKILIAENADGTTRIVYNSVAYLRDRYGLTPEVVANLAVIDQLAAAIAH
ncbi:DUF302 domain-containing protein [Silvibacterium sp.]|uniref:DUF302 domain-containing protein n=1 Tax=Silvibacterium sp. TaxID=1964179 RepID=UPI0039E463B6